MALSKRLRFEILRRDNHTCRYCGGTAPDVTLTVDHVMPLALGGTDDSSNLVAACRDCNSGKTSMPAGAPLVDDVAADALRWARAMQAVAETQAGVREERNDLHKRFWDEWQKWGGGDMPADWQESIDRFLRYGLTFGDLLEHLDIAQRKTGIGDHVRFKYFCGVSYRVLTQRQEAAAAILATDES